jgi:hypothetical protein
MQPEPHSHKQVIVQRRKQAQTGVVTCPRLHNKVARLELEPKAPLNCAAAPFSHLDPPHTRSVKPGKQGPFPGVQKLPVCDEVHRVP